METEFRKIPDGISDDIGGLRIIERRQLMGDINEVKRTVHAKQLAFDGAN
jgi:hypothetical protein